MNKIYLILGLVIVFQGGIVWLKMAKIGFVADLNWWITLSPAIIVCLVVGFVLLIFKNMSM